MSSCFSISVQAGGGGGGGAGFGYHSRGGGGGGFVSCFWFLHPEARVCKRGEDSGE